MAAPAAAKPMVHHAELRLGCGTPGHCEAVRRALAVEVQDGPDGSATELACEGPTLAVRIRADDLPALRAAVTTALRLGDAALRLP